MVNRLDGDLFFRHMILTAPIVNRWLEASYMTAWRKAQKMLVAIYTGGKHAELAAHDCGTAIRMTAIPGVFNFFFTGTGRVGDNVNDFVF
ncbi:MAG: hypothetical protein GY854_02120 [Deltaproteobacteria bacterium]|nr:hypothetical protein [Deltaproteobacteria bacterium]